MWPLLLLLFRTSSLPGAQSCTTLEPCCEWSLCFPCRFAAVPQEVDVTKPPPPPPLPPSASWTTTASRWATCTRWSAWCPGSTTPWCSSPSPCSSASSSKTRWVDGPHFIFIPEQLTEVFTCWTGVVVWILLEKKRLNDSFSQVKVSKLQRRISHELPTRKKSGKYVRQVVCLALIKKFIILQKHKYEWPRKVLWRNMGKHWIWRKKCSDHSRYYWLVNNNTWLMSRILDDVISRVLSNEIHRSWHSNYIQPTHHQEVGEEPHSARCALALPAADLRLLQFLELQALLAQPRPEGKSQNPDPEPRVRDVLHPVSSVAWLAWRAKSDSYHIPTFAIASCCPADWPCPSTGSPGTDLNSSTNVIVADSLLFGSFRFIFLVVLCYFRGTQSSARGRSSRHSGPMTSVGHNKHSRWWQAALEGNQPEMRLNSHWVPPRRIKPRPFERSKHFER